MLHPDGVSFLLVLLARRTALARAEGKSSGTRQIRKMINKQTNLKTIKGGHAVGRPEPCPALERRLTGVGT